MYTHTPFLLPFLAPRHIANPHPTHVEETGSTTKALIVVVCGVPLCARALSARNLPHNRQRHMPIPRNGTLQAVDNRKKRSKIEMEKWEMEGNGELRPRKTNDTIEMSGK